MNLILLSHSDMIDDDLYCIADNRSDHIRNLLKLTVGESLNVGILNGRSGRGTIEQIQNKKITIRTSELTLQPEAAIQIDLICALPRPQTLKKILITAGIFGIRQIHLIRANRVEKSYYQSMLLQPENYERFLIEGMSQGMITRMPAVSIHQKFKPFFEDFIRENYTDSEAESLRLLPEPGTQNPLSSAWNSKAKEIILAVGPEGGWVDFELSLMKDCRFLPFKLSESILRVEHAVTASLAQIELLQFAN